MLSGKQHDKLKGWLNTARKKTARLSTRITASLGLISLTRDEEFERHYECFKHIEKTLKTFVKNILTFVEHFEHFLLSLQNTTENLSDFYRNRSHQRELDELKRKNKVLTCEYYQEFRRTIDRQVVAVASQLLQKFSGPHHTINKRSAKLLDYDNKTKEMESSSDPKKKAALRDEYVIAKEIYDRINRQLIEELPVFNQFCIEIFKECILVLLESRRNLILAYTNQTLSLLNTPLMSTYTASNIASQILMSGDAANLANNTPAHQTEIAQNDNSQLQHLEDEPKDSGRDTKPSSATDFLPRRQSISSQLSSEFEQMAVINREISSTPLSQVDCDLQHNLEELSIKYDEPDGVQRNDLSVSERATSETDKVVDSGDIRSSVQETIDLPPRERRKKRKPQIYIASWPFIATGPNQLTVTCRQPLKLIKPCDECGNSDWSLVQDKKGQLGYVPSSYITKKE